MKTSRLLVCILMVAVELTQAQSVAWMDSYFYGKVGDLDVHSNGRSVTAVIESQSIIYNGSDAEMALGSEPNAAAAWLISKDGEGNIEWAFPLMYGPSYVALSDVEFAADGSIYVAGSCGQNTDLDPGSEEFVFPGAGAVFLAKYSTSGDFLWAIPAGGYQQFPNNYLQVDADGTIIMTGTFSGTVDFDPGNGQSSLSAISTNDNTYICRYTSEGQLVWAKAIRSGGHARATSVAINANGNVLIAGVYDAIWPGQSPLDLDPGSGTFPVYGNDLTPGASAFFSLLDQNGEFITGYGVEDISIVTPGSVIATADNGFMVWGEFTRNFDADFGTSITVVEVVGALNYSDLFMLKLGSNLEFEWVRVIGNDMSNNRAYRIRQMDNGNYMASGAVNYGDLDVDTGVGEFIIAGGTASGPTSFLLKMDSDGQFLWAEQASNGGLCELMAFEMINNEDIVLTVSAPGVTTFTPHLNYTPEMFVPNKNNVFLIGKIQFGVPTTLAEQIVSGPKPYPQPSSNYVKFAGDLTNAGSYTVYSETGVAIKSGPSLGALGILDVSDLHAGYYHIRFVSADHKRTEQCPLVIVR